MKKKIIQISIILVILIFSTIIFLKYSPNIDDKNIKSATLTKSTNEDQELNKAQINEIISFINSAGKTRKIGVSKGYQYIINIKRKNYTNQITLNGDQLTIDNSTYTSKNITKKFKNLLLKIGG